MKQPPPRRIKSRPVPKALGEDRVVDRRRHVPAHIAGQYSAFELSHLSCVSGFNAKRGFYGAPKSGESISKFKCLPGRANGEVHSRLVSACVRAGRQIPERDAEPPRAAVPLPVFRPHHRLFCPALPFDQQRQLHEQLR
jgi:hypothetical protein